MSAYMGRIWKAAGTSLENARFLGDRDAIPYLEEMLRVIEREAIGQCVSDALKSVLALIPGLHIASDEIDKMLESLHEDVWVEQIEYLRESRVSP